MDKLLFYEIDTRYICFLAQFDQHLFQNAKIAQNFSRKYIGILFEINGMKYFAPLSSFKDKRVLPKVNLDFFIKANKVV